MEYSSSQQFIQQPHPTEISEDDPSCCYTLNNKIIIFYRQCVFQISRQIDGIKNIDFLKQPREGYILPENIISSQPFRAIYGIKQLKESVWLILITQSKEVANINDNAIFKVSQVKFIQITSRQYEPLIIPLEKSFQILSFYYSYIYTIQRRLQHEYDHISHNFLSNFNYTLKIPQYPIQLYSSFIVGYAKTLKYQKQEETYKLTIISRGNCNRLGRRWLKRGLDEDFNSSTEYQTEILYQAITNKQHSIYSHVQMRGSIPLYWRQIPCFQLKASIQVCQNHNKNTTALKQYISNLEKENQGKIIFLNLIDKYGRQGYIGDRFKQYFDQANAKKTRLVWFDYHQQFESDRFRAETSLFQEIISNLQDGGFYHIRKKAEDDEFQPISNQTGIIRTNCIDCLDRTNHIQSLIAKSICKQFYYRQSLDKNISQQDKIIKDKQLNTMFGQLWKENGNSISLQNCGTNCMKLDYLQYGKRTSGGLFHDFFVGLKRFYLGHFQDFYLQNCLDLHFQKINFERDQSDFNGNNKKIYLYLLAQLSPSLIFPFLAQRIIGKKQQIYTIKTMATITLISTSVALFLVGFILKRCSSYFLSQPISRKQQCTLYL